MKTRNVATIAVVVVLALIAAGVGYAYTATTVSTSNSITTEEVLVELYGKSGSQLIEQYDYSEDVKTVKYSNYIVGSGSGEDVNKVTRYAVAEDVDLFTIDTVTLKSTGDNPKTLSKLTFVISKELFATTADLDDKIHATLTQGSKVWEGTAINGTTWVFTKSNEVDPSEQTDLVATSSGSNYVFSFELLHDEPVALGDLTSDSVIFPNGIQEK